MECVPELTRHRQRAIDIVKNAIEEDQKQNYEEAYKLYSNSLDYFMLALKCACTLSSDVPVWAEAPQMRRTRSLSCSYAARSTST